MVSKKTLELFDSIAAEIGVSAFILDDEDRTTLMRLVAVLENRWTWLMNESGQLESGSYSMATDELLKRIIKALPPANEPFPQKVVYFKKGPETKQ